jgi:hypothetical protein
MTAASLTEISDAAQGRPIYSSIYSAGMALGVETRGVTPTALSKRA